MRVSIFEHFSFDSLMRALGARNSAPVPEEPLPPRISSRARKQRRARKARNRQAAASRRRNRA